MQHLVGQARFQLAIAAQKTEDGLVAHRRRPLAEQVDPTMAAREPRRSDLDFRPHVRNVSVTNKLQLRPCNSTNASMQQSLPSVPTYPTMPGNEVQAFRGICPCGNAPSGWPLTDAFKISTPRQARAVGVHCTKRKRRLDKELSPLAFRPGPPLATILPLGRHNQPLPPAMEWAPPPKNIHETHVGSITR